MNPFRIEGPARISFSGGRTSAYMLRRILDAHGGRLPEDVHVVFANTGKERPETLDFIQECATRWDVRVRWIESWIYVVFQRFAGVDASGNVLTTPERSFSVREVSYDTASRDGEPFETLIRASRYLPNPVMRKCTGKLKVEAINAFARDHLRLDEWTSVVGLRADEPRRVAKMRAQERPESGGEIGVELPLADARVTIGEVMAFWAAQPFDLRLRPDEGNCDLCFLKGLAKISRIMRAHPELADWWIRMERIAEQEGWKRPGHPGDGRFRHDRPSYVKQLKIVQSTPLLPGIDLDGEDDGALPCACTD